MGDPISIPTRTHEQLMALFMGVLPNGIVCYVPKENGVPTFGFSSESVNPELFNLLAASGLLYKVASNVRDMLEMLSFALEEKGLDELVPSILAHQSAIHTAMRCATDGIEKVLKTPK